MGDNPYLHSNDAVVAEEQVQCYELRLQGKSIRGIAEILKMSKSTVERRISAEVKGRVLPLAEEVRQMEIDRLDSYLEKLHEQIEQGRGVPRCVEVAVKVAERRAKLLGVDAPEKVDATLHEVSQADLELSELLREQDAKNAIIESGLGTTTGDLSAR